MNENPEGTPNPLSSNGGANQNSAGVSPESAAPVETMAEVREIAVDSLDPTGRPMAQTVVVQEPPKKKKTGLVVAIVLALLVLIGGITAAVVVAMNALKKPDVVAMAMQKIMAGEAPKNVTIDGTIDILVNNPGSSIKRVNVNLDSDVVVGSMINTSSAVLTFTDKYNKDYSVKFDEVYAAQGDLFFKIEGATAALEESGILNTLMNGVEAMTDGVLSVVEQVDGAWLRLSNADADTLNAVQLDTSTISCVTDLVSGINKNSNSAAELYGKYPFIASTTDGVIIASRQNPVYLVGIDSENFTEFVNSIRNTEMSSELYNCLGLRDNVNITEEDIVELIEAMPDVYAEVDSENNFTRLYLETDVNDGAATAVIDLNLSYPTNVTVSEPVEYTDFSDVIQTIMTTMFNMPGAEGAGGTEVVEQVTP